MKVILILIMLIAGVTLGTSQDSLKFSRLVDRKGADTIYQEIAVVSIGANFVSLRSKSFNIKQRILKTEEAFNKTVYYLTCRSKITIYSEEAYIMLFYNYKVENSFYCSKKNKP